MRRRGWQHWARWTAGGWILLVAAWAAPACATAPFRVLGVADGLPSDQVDAIAQDPGGLLWLATPAGTARYDGWLFRNWREQAGPADEPLPAEAPAWPAPTRQLRDRNGGVWRADGHRTWREPPAAGGVAPRRLWPSPVLPFAAEAMFEDRDGGLWFGGRGRGLWYLPPTGLAVVSVAVPDGVLAVVRGTGAGGRVGLQAGDRAWWLDPRRARLLPATPGALLAAVPGPPEAPGAGVWRATRHGLEWSGAAPGEHRRFGLRDGLPVQDLHGYALHLTADGFGVVPLPGRLLLFDARALAAARSPPPMALDRLVLHRDGRPQVLSPAQGLFRVGPGDRDLRLSVRRVSFTEPQPPRYRFRVLGHDSGWVDAGSLGERALPALPAGRYRIEVAVAGADGQWSAPSAVTLLVDPPWWLGRGALAGSGLFVLGLLTWAAWSHRARLRRREAWRLAQARQQLAEQSSEAKSRFLATLGHEIRTPMTGVLGMAELLQGSELAPRQRAQVEAIQNAGRHLLRLVNDALDLARIEAGKLVLEDAPFPLRELLADVAALLRPLAAAKGLAFSLRCDPDVPAALRGDATRLRQVLLNLGGNAIKFCERGEVALHVGPRSPVGIVLHVRDTGPGLSAAQQARMFQRFEQGDAIAGLRYGGSGLGLAICQELAAAMGGSVSVRSEPGRGADFRVELPLPAADLPGAAPRLAPAEPTGPAGLRLLLVEDDPLVASVVSGLLERQGHGVVHAAHGLAALSELQLAPFDAALLDLDLPGLDGFELARLLRAQGCTLPLLALTARADAEAEPRALAAGMDGFLRKPVTGAMLAAALAGLDRPRAA